MVCPNCGLSIEQQYAETCPRCGYRLAQQSAPPPLSGQTPTSPAAGGYGEYAPTPGYGTPQPGYGTPQPGYGTQPPTAAYGAYPPQQAPGTPSPYSGYPQQGTPQGYGQAAHPSQWPQPQPGYAGFPPPPQQPRKRGAGCIIGAVLSVVLILAVVGAIGVILLRNGTSGPAASGTATVAPTPTPLPLYQNSFTSDAEGWADDPGRCFYQSGGYHVNDGYICYAPIGNQTDVDVTVDVKQLKGKTTAGYGIALRIGKNGEEYGFYIDSNGKYAIVRCGSSDCTRLRDFTATPAIHGGLNTSNTIRVVARSSRFEFFVNGQSVATIDDATYSTGAIGLECTSGVECVFNNLLITRPL